MRLGRLGVDEAVGRRRRGSCRRSPTTGRWEWMDTVGQEHLGSDIRRRLDGCGVRGPPCPGGQSFARSSALCIICATIVISADSLSSLDLRSIMTSQISSWSWSWSSSSSSACSTERCCRPAAALRSCVKLCTTPISTRYVSVGCNRQEQYKESFLRMQSCSELVRGTR